MNASMMRRLNCGAAHAKVWLDGLDTVELPVAPRALHEIALRISNRQVRLHEVIEGRGAAVIHWRSLTCLVQSRRPELLRFLLRGITAGKVEWSTSSKHVERSESDREQRAAELGALGLSYAQDQDLTIACATLQLAGRLRQRHPLLDEVAGFILDQQTGAGPFGLFLTVAETDRMRLLTTELRCTVDSLAALDSYLLRS